MKFGAFLVILAAAVVSTAAQSRQVMRFTYESGSTAAYPPGTVIIYSPGANVVYSAGASVTYLSNIRVMFPTQTEIYTQSGPRTFEAGTNVTIPALSQTAFAPGTSVVYITSAETRYEQFNINTHAIASYPQSTSVSYYYGPNGSNLIYMKPGTNPMVYYNPGGFTQFGPSALPVEKEMNPPNMIQSRTYGGGSSYGGGGGYSYCGGYSYNGYPQTNYYNCNTGYRSSCSQTGYNSFNYGGGGNGGYNGGGGNGGYNGGGMNGGGGCYYGGGAYYASGGGNMGYGK